jgi:serine/threonine protein kinase
MPELEGTFVGPYFIKKLLGRGGMSDVYLAYDEAMQRDVALKMMNAHSRDYLERFRREAEAIDKLQHEHILPALDYEENEYWHYLVMMYVPGGTLRDQLKYGPLSLDETAVIFTQLADAVQYAHDNNVLHRDIKPSNVLMLRHDYIYLADFGLAKIIEGTGHLTLSGTLMGTPEYMAPDLAEGPATISTDIYALGVVLYQMLTGYLPFDGETPISIFWKHLSEIAQPPSQLNPLIPPAVDHVVMRALAKHPQLRYVSANEMATAYLKALTAVPAPELIAIDAEMYKIDNRNPLPQTPQQARQRYPLSSARRYITARSSNLYQNVRKRVIRRRRYTSDMQGYQPPYAHQPHLRVTGDPIPMPALPPRSDPEMLDGQEISTPHEIPRRRHARNLTRSQNRAHSRTGMVATIAATGIFLFVILPLCYFTYLRATQPTTVIEPTEHASTHTTQSITGIQNSASASGTLILQDTLANNNSGRWAELPQNCIFAGQSYHVFSNPGTHPGSTTQPCTLITPLLDNAQISVNASLLAGNSVGIILRMHDEQFYTFQINNHEQFFFLRHDTNGGSHYSTLIGPTSSSTINPGSATNRLMVIAKGNDFKLYINDIFVGETHDSTYSNGQLAFTANTEGSFTQLQIQHP